MTDTASGAPEAWRRAVAIEIVRLLAIAGVLAIALAQFLPERGPPPALPRELPAGWSQIAWPYLRDQFDAGLAARCTGPGCAHAIEITIRPKRGFCDCERGVYDDTALREVGDLDLAGVFTPQAPGAPVTAGGLAGRYRAHTGDDGGAAASAALHSGCDVIVIVARGPGGAPVAGAMLDFLNEPRIADWLGGLLKQGKA